MIRLLLYIFGAKDYESCKSCETLKMQLDYANAEKKELMETLLALTKPAVVVQPVDTKILNPLQQSALTFARRRGLLEQSERIKTDVIRTSPYIAKPDDLSKGQQSSNAVTPQSIEKLENELGLVDEKPA